MTPSSRRPGKGNPAGPDAPSRRALLSAGFAGVALGGCALLPETGGPDLRIVYNRAAGSHGPDRNPIIVIPGILGSRLVDMSTRQTIWGAFDRSAAQPGNAADIRKIALPLQGFIGERPAADHVMPDGVLDRVVVRLAGIPIEMQQYAQILATLGAGGYRDPALGLGGIDYGDDHFTCFQFPYDWRRDNAENAGELKRFMDDRRVYLAEQYRLRFGVERDPSTIRFDVVTHSMGALLFRYFLRYGDQPLVEDGPAPSLDWSGASYVGRAILVAPPNAGSALSLKYLVEGQDLGRPVLPFYAPAILGTYPSAYQLLPHGPAPALFTGGAARQPISDLYDPDLWQSHRWGLSDPGQGPVIAAILPDEMDPEARARIAMQRQAVLLKRARRFHAALDAPAATPPGLEAFLVVGDSLATDAAYAIGPEGRLVRTLTLPGDGTVTRANALFDTRTDDNWSPEVQSPLRFRSTLLLSGEHIRLTRSSVFKDNVLYWLLEEPRESAGATTAL
ncbi:lipase/acyltransferase domain-containing protein [Brevundimonas sp.]|uniref:lipase/acyltransferase domain-containing protein n=1 Tax=Brevundimonas sp. TaxID=1871086 RepID=UPI003F6E7476